MDFDGIERVDVNSLGGNDVLSVDDLAATRCARSTTTRRPRSAARRPTRAPTRRSSTRPPPTTSITAAGAAGSAAVTGLAAAVNVAHAEAARDALTINALGGDDQRRRASTLGADALKLTEDGGAGNDTLAGGRGADVLVGGDGNDAVDGNRGNDVALLGAGDDRFTWDPGDGSDTIEGQDGSDAMTFNGANVAEQFDVSANGGRVRFFRNVATITMDLNDVERIDTQRPRRRRHGDRQRPLRHRPDRGQRRPRGALGGATGDGAARPGRRQRHQPRRRGHRRPAAPAAPR